MMERQPEPELMDLESEAAAYADADFAEVNAAFVERLLELIGHHDHPVAVDLGTGPGDIPLRIAAGRGGWRILAVDASWAMLQRAREASRNATAAEAVHFIQADVKRLPVTSRSCDIVFSNSILHHVSGTAAFWAEVRRIARRGTWVLVRDLVRPGSRDEARQLVDRYAGGESPLLQEEFYRSFLAAYTPEEVREQIAQAGLVGLGVELVTDRHLDVVGRIA